MGIERRVQIIRTITVEESAGWFSRDELPEILWPLYDGTKDVDDLDEEQQAALDDLVSGSDLQLEDTIDTGAWGTYHWPPLP